MSNFQNFIKDMHISAFFQSDYNELKEKEAEARAKYHRKKLLEKNPSAPPQPSIDNEIKDQTKSVLKKKWNKRAKLRQDQWKVVEQRRKDLADIKKERNVLSRKEGEVWKCGESYKMEWTNSPQ